MGLRKSFFAAMYDPMSRSSEDAGLREMRHSLLAEAAGDVLEIGAGTGANLAHFDGVESLGWVDLAELALDDAVAGVEAPAPAGADVHLLDGGVVAPPLGDQLRIRPDGEDVLARRVEDPLDADFELVGRGHRGLVHAQLTACLTSFTILASSALLSFVSA